MSDFFFPHKLFIIPEGENSFSEYGVCRDQPNKSGSVITAGERVGYVFQSLIWLPKNKNSKRFIPGEKIKVIGDHGETRLEAKVVRFEFGGLEEDRIWI